MESPSIVVNGLVSVAEPIDRGRFQARIGRSLTADTRKSKDGSEHVQACRMPALPADLTQDDPAGGTYTLRVKPDRRRAQVPIAPDADRRST